MALLMVDLLRFFWPSFLFSLVLPSHSLFLYLSKLYPLIPAFLVFLKASMPAKPEKLLSELIQISISLAQNSLLTMPVLWSWARPSNHQTGGKWQE